MAGASHAFETTMFGCAVELSSRIVHARVSRARQPRVLAAVAPWALRLAATPRPATIGRLAAHRRQQVSVRASSDSMPSIDDLPLPELEFPDDEDETDPLDNWNLLRILHSEMPDQEVNDIVWYCLGYRKNEMTGVWDPVEVFPKWKERYPTPPDVIGVTRIYTKGAYGEVLQEVDDVSLKANQALVRSIPQECKQNLKKVFRPYGFTGFKMEGLTPNKTRRAQVVNWLLYYRDHLRGKTFEQLIAERDARKAAGIQSVREKPMM